MELWPAGDPQRPRLLLQLAHAQFEADEATVELLEDARDGLLAQGDREGAAEAEWLLGGLAEAHGHGEDAFVHVRRAVALLEATGPSPVKTGVLCRLAGVLTRSGQAADAIRVGREALAMAEALGLEAQRSRLLDLIGLARVLNGDHAGVTDQERAAAVAKAANLPEAATAVGNLAETLIVLGDLPRGFELQAEARQVAERFGSVIDRRWLQVCQSWEDHTRGRWDAALQATDQFLAEVEAGAPHFDESPCRALRGVIRLARGDLAGALADAALAVELAVRRDEPEMLLGALAIHARALLASGRVEEAGASADELVAVLAARGATAATPYWPGELAVVLHGLGRAAELVELAAGIDTPTPWLRAAADMAAGDFERAADRYAQLGSMPDEAFARLRAAGQLLAAGRRVEGNARLQQALAFYRQVRAAAYVREAEALLAASA